MLEAVEVRKLLAAAGGSVKAMILLGINCGFGQSDLAAMPLSAVGKRVDFPRPKTEVHRRCPSGSETIAELRRAIKARLRPRAAADAGLAFFTNYGKR